VTNLTQDIHPDGSRMTIVEEVLKQRVATWVEDGTIHSLTNFIRIDPPKVRRFRRVWQPIEVTPPPLPTVILTNVSGASFRLQSIPMVQGATMLVAGVSNAVIATARFANGTDTNEPTADYCRMFRVDFATETNWIYGLESSNELATWTLCPPEIDGTGQPDYFFDIDEGSRNYRLAIREGVLTDQ
jgi:hypothetical protein